MIDLLFVCTLNSGCPLPLFRKRSTISGFERERGEGGIQVFCISIYPTYLRPGCSSSSSAGDHGLTRSLMKMEMEMKRLLRIELCSGSFASVKLVFLFLA